MESDTRCSHAHFICKIEASNLLGDEGWQGWVERRQPLDDVGERQLRRTNLRFDNLVCRAAALLRKQHLPRAQHLLQSRSPAFWLGIQIGGVMRTSLASIWRMVTATRAAFRTM